MDPDGVVKVWNFSTGEVLLTLQAPPQDLTNIMHLDIGNAQYFVGVGWGRSVIIWPDILVSNNETIEIKKVMSGHKEDIQCMDFMLPNCLATGSYDGEILLWNLDSLTMRSQNPRLVRPEVKDIPHSRRGIEALKFVTCRNRHNFILSTGGRAPNNHNTCFVLNMYISKGWCCRRHEGSRVEHGPWHARDVHAPFAHSS
jgi:WD40 repeat protein